MAGYSFLQNYFEFYPKGEGGVNISKIIDLHCDTISLLNDNKMSLYNNSCHFDLKRALDAGIIVQFFALFTNAYEQSVSLRNVLLQIEKFYLELSLNDAYLYLITKYADIKNNQSSSKIGAVLHLEGAEAIGNDLEILSLLYRLGLRSMGLTWNNRNLLADGIGMGDEASGLTKFGKAVLREMQKLGMLLDLSHISERAYFEAFNYYNYPIMVTHSNVRQLCSHQRNLTDKQLKVLAENDGIVGINQVSYFISSEPDANINQLLNHIKYIADKIGIRHIALGSDFDGAESMVMSGVEEYKSWPDILSQQGFLTQEIDMILYCNAKRVMEKVLSLNLR